jgi:hypothetical protein
MGEIIFQEIRKKCVDRSMYKTKQTEVQYATVYYKKCDVGCVLENDPESTSQQQTVENKTNISNHNVLFH